MNKKFFLLFSIFVPTALFSTPHLQPCAALEENKLDPNIQVIAPEGQVLEEDKKILEGIVTFGNIDVTEIMKPRVDVVAVNSNDKFKKLIQVIIDSGYSRIPVFEETPDNIKGVLYIKDLLPYLENKDNFKWNKLIRGMVEWVM